MKAILAAGLILAATISFSQTTEPQATEPASTPETEQQSSPETADQLVSAPAAEVPVLTVNGDPVLGVEVDVAVQMLAGQIMKSGGTVNEEEIIDSAVQQVVASKLLAQEARRNNYEPDMTQVRELLDKITARAGGKDKIGTVFGVPDLSYETAAALVAEGELVHKFLDGQVRASIDITDEQVKAFYDENPKIFEHDEEIHVLQIIMAVDANDGDEERTAARSRAEKARERALAGEDFSTLADEISEGPGAGRGGDLGFFPADRMVPEFSKVALALEPGEISEVVETIWGFHVIKMLERREAGIRPMAEAADEIRSSLQKQELGKATDALLVKLNETAVIVQLTPERPADQPSAE